MAEVISPDRLSGGLSSKPLEAGRYDGQSDHPAEVAGLLAALMPSGKRVLDVGCGTGSVALIANRDKGNQLLCIEPDPERAAIARSRGLDVITGFLDNDIVRQRGPFDVVMASDVIEHTPDPAAFLMLLRSAISPDGLILLSLPNVAHWSVRYEMLRGRFQYQPTGIMDATHLRWFTERTLRSLVEQCRLHVADYRYTAGFDLEPHTTGLWKIVPYRVRVPLIVGLVRMFPRLCGVQHVVALTCSAQ